MIYSLSFQTKNYVLTKMTPCQNTFIIQISNPYLEIEIESGYFGHHSITCLDDVISNNYYDVMSLNQARELLKTIRYLDKQPHLLDVVICCDTGKTMSSAIATFIKQTIPNTKIYQKIEEANLNRYTLILMHLSNCKGLNKPLLKRAKLHIVQLALETKSLLRLIKNRNLKTNVNAFIGVIKDNF